MTLETTFELRVNRTLSGVAEDSIVRAGGEAQGPASRWHELCGMAGPPTGRGVGLEKSGEMKGINLSSETKSQDAVHST